MYTTIYIAVYKHSHVCVQYQLSVSEWVVCVCVNQIKPQAQFVREIEFGDVWEINISLNSGV